MDNLYRLWKLALETQNYEDFVKKSSEIIQEIQSKKTGSGFSVNQERKIIGEETSLKAVLTLSKTVSKTNIPVLLLGETGSGKELVARYIHENSERLDKAFIRINCAAIAPGVIDSELFGHEKGSFTGAVRLRKGCFELAHEGTLFMDEVAELSLEAQARLLRVLNDGFLSRVGSEKNIKVDVRILAATHRNLKEMVQSGTFREDLYYRIASFPVSIPALRERKEDISELAKYYISECALKFNIRVPTLNEEGLLKLQEYNWPGNIREFIAVIERAVLLSNNGFLNLSFFDVNQISDQDEKVIDLKGFSSKKIKEMDESEKILEALHKSHGRIEGPFGAAKILDMNPSTLRSHIKKLNVVYKKAA
jgi:transcriptional regulator with GAF, ATPase, and Fis domain